MTTSTQSIGVVSALQGKVFAHASNGKVRLLALGDGVFANEVIVTASGAQVEITFFDRPAVFVDELQKLPLDTLMTAGGEGDDSAGLAPLGASEAATVVEDRAPAQETFSDTAVRDTTRAGVVEVAEAEAEGNNFVDLPRIGEVLPIPEYAFPLNPPGSPPEIEGPLREVSVVEEPPPPPDDGPDARVVDPVADRLMLDESFSGTDTATIPETAQLPAGRNMATANLADNFASPIDYGADGAGSVSYALNLVDAGGNGIASGMYALTSGSIARGASILLSMDGADVVGKAVGTEYFRISVNNDPLSADFGKVTFSQSNNIWHQNSGGSADTAALLALVGGDRLNLVQTVTDADGDYDSASIDLGTNVFSIQDSGPTPLIPSVVVANEIGGHAISSMFQPSTDPLLTADLSGNIAGWNTGATPYIHDSTNLSVEVAPELYSDVYFYVDPAAKHILYAYTDSDALTNYSLAEDLAGTQNLIFKLTLDPAGDNIGVEMFGKLFVDATSIVVPFNTLANAQSGSMLYAGTDKKVYTVEPAQLLFSIDSEQGGISGDVRTINSGVSPGLIAVGGAGDTLADWTNGNEVLIFDFSGAEAWDFTFNPNFNGLGSGGSALIRWTVYSSVGGYFESGDMLAIEGQQNEIPTSIANIDKVLLQEASSPTANTAFAILSAQTKSESDTEYTFQAAVIDNDNSQSSASFVLKFEGSKDVSDANLLIGGVGGSPLSETLRGTVSDEYLVGGSGNDVLVGGGGADTFVWRLSDVPSGTTTDKILDFGTTDRLDLRDLLGDASLSPSIVIDNGGAGARVSVSYTEGASLHSQEIQIAFDGAGDQTLVNDNGIVKVG